MVWVTARSIKNNNTSALEGADAVLHLAEEEGSVEELELENVPPSIAA
ncbi:MULTISPECIES: hypothetical protein [unclassified Mesorhizobium]|nr:MULTISPECIES: hypothetical protein [Mesorhizobium]